MLAGVYNPKLDEGQQLQQAVAAAAATAPAPAPAAGVLPLSGRKRYIACTGTARDRGAVYKTGRGIFWEDVAGMGRVAIVTAK